MPATAEPEVKEAKTDITRGSLMSNWMSEIEKIPITKEEPSGKITPAERPSELAPADKPVVGDSPPTEKAGKVAPKPAGDDKAGVSDPKEEKTAPTPKPDAAKAVEDKDDDFGDAQQPKSKPDWENFKKIAREKKAALKDKLTKEIQERDAKLAELNTRLTEVESKPAAQEDPRVKAQLERLEAENKELTDRITALNVTEHPKFKAYFQGKVDEAIGEAKMIVGDERAERIAKLLSLPDNEFRKLQLDEFLADLDDDGARTDIRGVVRDLRKIDKERDSEIKRANEHKSKLEGDTQAAQEKSKALRDEVFNQALKELTDPGKGFAPFQTREGDDAWNQGVQSRIDTVKGLLYSNNLKPEIIAKAAFHAVALPAVLESYRTESKAWEEAKASYESEIAKLVAAQPSGGGNGSSTRTESSGPNINRDSRPREVANNWAKSMAEAMHGTG